MKIGELKNIYEVFSLCDEDNYGSMPNRPYLDAETEVPENRLEQFQKYDVLLEPMRGKKIADFANPEDFELGNDPSFNDCFWCLASPVDDEDNRLLEAAGWSPGDIEEFSEIMNDYFDGELGDELRRNS